MIQDMRHRWHTAWRRAVMGCGVFTTLATVLAAPTAVDARPFAYVANTQARTVSVIDLANDSVIATISTGGGAQDVAITPDGNRAYVTGAGFAAVVVIDTNPSSPTFNTVIRTITIGGTSPYAVAVSPDGKRLALGAEDATLHIWNIAEKREESKTLVSDFPGCS